MSDRDHVAALIKKYEGRAPRYTSYPPIPYWRAVDGEQVGGWLASSAAESLSLYVHIPFCRAQCLYCGCFTITSPQPKPVGPYLQALFREMELVRERLGAPRRVRQLHLGGGTPTYLSPDEIAALVAKVGSLFSIDPDAELGIELDPRTVDPKDLQRLRALGFNRISLGVQDFDAEVQASVNRLQSAGQVRALIEAARQLGFRSVNFDLIYGLPRQTSATFAHTLDLIEEMAPDRIALYNFAYLPQVFSHQRRIAVEDLPEQREKLEIFLSARERLTRGGYQFIGMDHFARQDDELAVALRQGALRRNFMGYTTLLGADLLGFGISAISEFQGRFWQNEKRLSRYEATVGAGALPAVRGLELSAEDRLRQAVIAGLLCEGRLDFQRITGSFGVDPAAHFAQALGSLAEMAADGLVELDGSGVAVTETGRLFLRTIALPFDAYAGRQTLKRVAFSSTT